MFAIGCHISIAKGYAKAAEDALQIGANTFQFFTRNPRGGAVKELDQEDLKKFKKIAEEHNFFPLFAHAPYTMNLCSDKNNIRAFAKNIFAEDLKKLALLPESYYIFHPGSHVGQGPEKGIEYIIETINEVVTPDNHVTVLLEGMSGKGTEVGGSFEELAEIISGLHHKEKIGVCLDTCHLFAAGYDIVNDLDGVLEEFDKHIGLSRLKAIHLNDSKVPLGSKKDRHEVLGEGLIGLEPIIKIINHPTLKNRIFNLETPNELEGYAKEISLLRSRYHDH